MQEKSYLATEVGRFDSAIRSAQRRQSVFWILGVLWLGGVLAVSIFFYKITSKVARAEERAQVLTSSLQKQQQTAQRLVEELKIQRNELSRMTRALKVTQEGVIDSLPSERRREFALRLAEAQNEQRAPTEGTSQEKTELNTILKTLLRDEGSKDGANSAENHFLAGNALAADEKYREALKEFDAAIAADAKYARAYVSRAWINNELGRHDEAIKDCNQAIALEPQNATAYNNRGLARMALKEFPAAIADFSDAIAREKKYVYYANRASAYTYAPKPDYERAIQDYQEAATIAPTPSSPYIEIAGIQWKQGRFVEALKSIELAIGMDVGVSNAYSMRGLIKDDLGQSKEAIEDFSKAIQLDDSNDSAYAGLASILIDSGQFVEAIEKLTKAIELDANAVYYNNRGYAYLNLGDYDAAQMDLLKAISMSSDSGPAHAHLGQIYAKTGRLDEALKEVTLSIQLNPDYGRAYKYRAEIYRALGETEKANADLSEAKRIGDSSVRTLIPPQR